MIERKAAHPPEFYFRSRSIDPEKRCSTHFVSIVHGPANHHVDLLNPTPQAFPPRSAQAAASRPAAAARSDHRECAGRRVLCQRIAARQAGPGTIAGTGPENQQRPDRLSANPGKQPAHGPRLGCGGRPESGRRSGPGRPLHSGPGESAPDIRPGAGRFGRTVFLPGPEGQGVALPQCGHPGKRGLAALERSRCANRGTPGTGRLRSALPSLVQGRSGDDGCQWRLLDPPLSVFHRTHVRHHRCRALPTFRRTRPQLRVGTGLTAG